MTKRTIRTARSTFPIDFDVPRVAQVFRAKETPILSRIYLMRLSRKTSRLHSGPQRIRVSQLSQCFNGETLATSPNQTTLSQKEGKGYEEIRAERKGVHFKLFLFPGISSTCIHRHCAARIALSCSFLTCPLFVPRDSYMDGETRKAKLKRDKPKSPLSSLQPVVT